ncbi:hypothetical protein [Raineyella sp. W15-4]|uniref:hypothetical protein n=1 Tax=Raineyella sp. W15-4 TaxID=3081651 RepID=UPI0029557AA3|nr:hypothetical protein [Raineyella sp. W15-4]WOQ17365.1 hypothetical protein R0145_01230 [Raineyella sp. W15-4]
MSTTVIPATDDVSAAAAALQALRNTAGGEVLARQLSRLIVVIADEAARTKRFRGDLLAALAVEPEAEAGPTGPLTPRRLERLTKAELKKLIDRDGMDPDRRIKSRSTKAEMVDLVLAFQAAQAQAEPAPAEIVADDTASSEAVPTTPPLPPANPPKRRRQPSPLDPYAVAASDGVDGLRDRLQRLDIEQLKDVVAEYGMNYDGRAMTWKDHHRFVERIVEKTDFGAAQGSAFRSGRTSP